jgi:hypothetical protein
LAGIIPSTLLDVEGSARTLTWVEVIPSTGIWVVGAKVVGGAAVSDGSGVCVAVAAEVLTRSVGVDIGSSLDGVLQPVYKRINRVKITLENRIDTEGF